MTTRRAGEEKSSRWGCFSENGVSASGNRRQRPLRSRGGGRSKLPRTLYARVGRSRPEVHFDQGRGGSRPGLREQGSRCHVGAEAWLAAFHDEDRELADIACHLSDSKRDAGCSNEGICDRLVSALGWRGGPLPQGGECLRVGLGVQLCERRHPRAERLRLGNRAFCLRPRLARKAGGHPDQAGARGHRYRRDEAAAWQRVRGGDVIEEVLQAPIEITVG
jgi:hypothetical protein